MGLEFKSSRFSNSKKKKKNGAGNYWEFSVGSIILEKYLNKERTETLGHFFSPFLSDDEWAKTWFLVQVVSGTLCHI